MFPHSCGRLQGGENMNTHMYNYEHNVSKSLHYTICNCGVVSTHYNCICIFVLTTLRNVSAFTMKENYVHKSKSICLSKDK